MFNNISVVKSFVILPPVMADADNRPGVAPPTGTARKSIALRVSAAVNEDRHGGPVGPAGEPVYLSPGRGAEGAKDV
jgi:hypothetical protein